jgi:outer membrane protein OmpA-like peptidoglycan-associated protein
MNTRNKAFRQHFILVPAIAALVACASGAQAAEHGKPAASRAEKLGLTTGIAVGAAVGGPFGAVIGGAAGGWLGDRQHRERVAQQELQRDRDARITEQARLSAEVEALTATLAQLEQRALLVEAAVQFRSGETGLRAEDQVRLKNFGRLLAQLPNARVRVAGFADASGAEDLNMSLALERAEMVARELQLAGVAPEQLVIDGHGERFASLLDSRDDAAFDRRVQIRLETAADAVASLE